MCFGCFACYLLLLYRLRVQVLLSLGLEVVSLFNVLWMFCMLLVAAGQAARADALARQLRRAETSRQQLNRLRTENDALKDLLLELAADRRSAQEKLSELQARVAEMVIKAPPEVSKGGGHAEG